MSSYEIPSWAGKPPTGFHLDVLKEDKLVQKLMVDEKKFYLFGRNSQLNDFCIDHASCSRVHAAFVYHKHLNIAYLVDLGSTHGTFIGKMRLEPHKPTQLHVNSIFHFGASTRNYILRERPSAGQRNNIMEDIPMSESSDGALLGLPESQTELDNLTEYNTAHNRRISMLGIVDDIRKNKNSRKRRNVTFNDEEIIINPEDIDPNVGRFRNLVQSTVVPAKRARYDGSNIGIAPSPVTHANNHQIFQHNYQEHAKNLQTPSSPTSSTAQNNTPSLYQGLPAASHESLAGRNDITGPLVIGAKLGLLLPNPAPDVTPVINEPTPASSSAKTQKLSMANANVRYEDAINSERTGAAGPQKKKYAKEAWPGRKPMLGSL
ncbi:nuclear inhibitor of protein phosphatase 1 [Stomoxys calcitrans]|uniref:Nuclear inhibitor of protein phosphatase 1 n=1 Tax=Stomoxys calcitrans TaxID=35570 RepID=A0A1I8NN77_STOCA|nr:nuclear inhibitor of protein phosphatase 1 [Stomoxys calcitrans]XP_013101896.1 nuclear inhibitor of protein phosphatase 1 [Stomoxys calcitrans]XP_013101897.1 nuclear inhibitor of protein phosphatase 1 [Stomoxys calcitrans]